LGRIADDLIAFPQEVEPDATEASFSGAGLSVKAADFGEVKKSGTLVKTSVGVVMVDREPETRTITLKLEVRPDADVTLPEAAARLEAIVGEMQERDTWLRRDFHVGGDFGSVLYHVSGEVSFGDFAGWQVGASPDVTLTLVCDYAAYSTEEVEHGPFESKAGERQLVYTLPASDGTTKGLKRIRVTNEGEEDWRGLIWSEECRHYKPGDPTAEPVYLAKNLTPKGGAEKATVSGAEIVRHTGLTAGRIAILGSEISGVGHMTHRGPRRMWMRVEQPSGDVGAVKLQLLWRPLGSSRWVEDNPIVSPYVVGGYCLVDLGECRPQLATVGDERWEWTLSAWAPGGSGAIRVRDVYPLSTEQFLKCYEPYQAPVADVQMTKSPGSLESVADPGRPAWSGLTNAKTSDDVRATCKLEIAYPGIESEVLKATNFAFALPSGCTPVGIIAQIERSRTANFVYDNVISIVKGGSVGAVNKALKSANWPSTDAVQSYGSASDLWGESWTFSDINSSGFGLAIQVVGSSGFNNGGELGIDQIKITAYYLETGDTEDRLCFSTRSLELSSDAVQRQHRTDDVWGRVVPDGFLPYDPSRRVSRGIIVPTQGDLSALPDSGPDPLSAAVATRAGSLYTFSGS
jgi:hypothetical protein